MEIRFYFLLKLWCTLWVYCVGTELLFTLFGLKCRRIKVYDSVANQLLLLLAVSIEIENVEKRVFYLLMRKLILFSIVVFAQRIRDGCLTFYANPIWIWCSFRNNTFLMCRMHPMNGHFSIDLIIICQQWKQLQLNHLIYFQPFFRRINCSAILLDEQMQTTVLSIMNETIELINRVNKLKTKIIIKIKVALIYSYHILVVSVAK